MNAKVECRRYAFAHPSAITYTIVTGWREGFYCILMCSKIAVLLEANIDVCFSKFIYLHRAFLFIVILLMNVIVACMSVSVYKSLINISHCTLTFHQFLSRAICQSERNINSKILCLAVCMCVCEKIIAKNFVCRPIKRKFKQQQQQNAHQMQTHRGRTKR